MKQEFDMQVTYTHLDGTVTTYTANTAITSKQYLGNSFVGHTAAEHLANLIALSDFTTVIYVTSFEGVPDTPKTLYYRNVTTYVTDFGLSTWAKERLSSTDHNTFVAQIDSISTPEQNPQFMMWWKKYVSDPNVVVQH
jgi:hypothetical protein